MGAPSTRESRVSGSPTTHARYPWSPAPVSAGADQGSVSSRATKGSAVGVEAPSSLVTTATMAERSSDGA
ncbi:MAG: hypothetical protein CMN29_22490 [Sandaracinus sp.]|nr:hypothetical protein [Sandaracinus sp.]